MLVCEIQEESVKSKKPDNRDKEKRMNTKEWKSDVLESFVSWISTTTRSIDLYTFDLFFLKVKTLIIDPPDVDTKT